MILLTTTIATILDIPLSISSPPSLRLRSSVPPSTSFTVSSRTASADETHIRLLPQITAALSSIPLNTTYHYPRCTLPPPPGEVDFHTNTSLLLGSSQATALPEIVDDLSDIYRMFMHNIHNEWSSLTLLHPTPKKLFLIPPRSSFFLGPLSSLSPFSEVLGKRDFVLLDPPWPNASAKRKRGGYKTESRFSIMPLLLGLPMCDVLNTGGVVGVWITNKPSIRRQLGSLLSAWCVDEVAEWVWVKTTSFGKPVFALDSKSGRRPYEVLVLARRSGGPEIPDKVIVGVPDLHSRKPGVKDLIEPFLPERYEAAEIFGRNLTEGWFTWGDEAIKWNWEGYWVSR